MTAAERPLRWGVLGAARIAEGYVLPALHRSTGSVPVAVASSRPQAGKRLVDTFALERAYDDYGALLADPDVEAVYLALPNASHARWTVAALKAGKHVLCEKPLAVSVEQVDAIAEAAGAADRVVVEAFMYRCHPQFRHLLELLGAGVIGQVRAMHGALSFVLDDPGDIRMAADLGGGALLDLGCYVVDAAVAVYGEAPRGGLGVLTPGPTGVDTHSGGVLDFGDGRTAVVEVSFRLPWLGSRLEVRGERGSLVLPQAFNPGTAPTELLVVDQHGARDRIEFPGVDMYQLMVEEFTAVVRGGGRPFHRIGDSRAVQLGLDYLRTAVR
ncbi:Gfo/Idh/MocA family protein [Actinokineospora fastidiosa]|uniref:Oxidoreductase n=1 Tax=Actinokineospora fastidiosa TaxID=1816 RepID=A0A918GKZ5_9PSEU|nr:Gfo/Idh/MocA family oxidoreductase [Actinokineospora fastidiosa]GGS45061.1 oxidoreductase [Actinokineospora fastidiosa]